MAAFERDAVTQRVIEELKRIYRAKLLPLEMQYRYDYYYNPYVSDAEFDSKPQVMLVGQYSVGKTSFIRYLLGRDFPGQRIGPEPTTDRFVAVMDGPDERIIPGNALAVSNDLPFKGLERFGVAFLNRFEGSQIPCAVLKNITLIDTPGVLSGEKQRVARGYDFNVVCGWFAQRADLILLLFDAHKLDISDEFKTVIESLKGNDDKIRCILNKADQVDQQKLVRIYGALMWSLGKVMKTPEVLRVYLGSFWDQPLMFDDNAALFEMEERDLMNDLRSLPRNSAVRKINELVKRVRTSKVHAYLCSYLKEQMPSFMGHQKKQRELLDSMGKVFRDVMKRYNLAPGDFPDLEDFKNKLSDQDFSKFTVLKPRMMEEVEAALCVDLPRLMEALPRSTSVVAATGTAPTGPLVYDTPPPAAGGGAVAVVTAAPSDNPWADEEEAANPFDEEDQPASAWALDGYIPVHKPRFDGLQSGGFVTGGAAKPVLTASGLPTSALKKIWSLADIDKDGRLDLQEFVIAMYLIDQVKQSGGEVPVALDESFIPVGKK